MSGHVLKVSNRCAPAGWRPQVGDPETRRLAAETLKHEVAVWLTEATGRGWSGAEAAVLLLKAAPAEDVDGYGLARRLEKFRIVPDARLVEILDGWTEALVAAIRSREAEAAARLKIDAPFGFAAAAIFHRPDGAPLTGTAFRIPEDRLGRCAFIADAEALDPGPDDIAVMSVGLEDVEVLGPPPPSAESMYPIAIAAVDADDNGVLLARLGRQADLDIGILDVDVVAALAMREAVGETPITGHLEMISSLMETVQRAMDDDDPHRTWVAALMAAAAARRLAILAGHVPDGDTTSRIVSEMIQDDAEEVSALIGGLGTAPVATLH